MAEDQPRLIVFAGPNGSGKSTITNGYLRSTIGLPALYINADIIAREQGLSAYDAAVEATRQRVLAIENMQSFMMETVFSTPGKLDLLARAKEKGFLVHLEFITTQSPKINIDRVRNRVLEGGHDVPVEKTVSRYRKSMGLAPAAIRLADTAVIYNNSFEHPVVLAEKSIERGWEVFPQSPPSVWAEQAIRYVFELEPSSADSLDGSMIRRDRHTP